MPPKRSNRAALLLGTPANAMSRKSVNNSTTIGGGGGGSHSTLAHRSVTGSITSHSNANNNNNNPDSSRTAGSDADAIAAEDVLGGVDVMKADVHEWVPDAGDLLRAKRIHDIAQQLAVSRAVLQAKLNAIEQRMSQTAARAVLPFQQRRAQAERQMLEDEIRDSERAIRVLNVMSIQMEEARKLKEAVFIETRDGLLQEIAELEKIKAENASLIRQGYVERINMLQRYWPWRQLLELGDTTVGATFAQELARGPRYRNVGIQNNIQSDYIAQQLHWLMQLSDREDTFRGYMKHLDVLVEDLADINNLLESTLTCSVCDMLFERPVLFWPCGHSFCAVCFESLLIAPNLHRCPVCGSIGGEGFVHNLILGETVAKWMFKDAGYGDLHGSLNGIRLHLSRFKRDKVQARIDELKTLLQQQRLKEYKRGAVTDKSIDISYRAY